MLATTLKKKMNTLSSERDKFTHSCGNLNCVLHKRMCLLHHSCRKVSNDAHLVHIALTVNLPEEVTRALSQITIQNNTYAACESARNRLQVI